MSLSMLLLHSQAQAVSEGTSTGGGGGVGGGVEVENKEKDSTVGTQLVPPLSDQTSIRHLLLPKIWRDGISAIQQQPIQYPIANQKSGLQTPHPSSSSLTTSLAITSPSTAQFLSLLSFSSILIPGLNEMIGTIPSEDIQRHFSHHYHPNSHSTHVQTPNLQPLP